MSNIETATEKRRAARIALALPVRIEMQENGNSKWREVTTLISVSNIGAGFYSSRKFEVGRLVRLSLPMPRQMRFYDEDSAHYEIWSIVRHCHPRSLLDTAVHHIGVAFTGKFPPVSYNENPRRLYKIRSLRDEGLWEITEDGQIIIPRKNPRYPIPIEVFVAKLDSGNNILSGERTVTENISLSGATVFSNLDAGVGEYVKVISDSYNFSSLAVVRHRRTGSDKLPRLHVEFVESNFPLAGIE